MNLAPLCEIELPRQAVVAEVEHQMSRLRRPNKRLKTDVKKQFSAVEQPADDHSHSGSRDNRQIRGTLRESNGYVQHQTPEHELGSLVEVRACSL
jgi:hypothetical protein